MAQICRCQNVQNQDKISATDCTPGANGTHPPRRNPHQRPSLARGGAFYGWTTGSGSSSAQAWRSSQVPLRLHRRQIRSPAQAELKAVEHIRQRRVLATRNWPASGSLSWRWAPMSREGSAPGAHKESPAEAGRGWLNRGVEMLRPWPGLGSPCAARICEKSPAVRVGGAQFEHQGLGYVQSSATPGNRTLSPGTTGLLQNAGRPLWFPAKEAPPRTTGPEEKWLMGSTVLHLDDRR